MTTRLCPACIHRRARVVDPDCLVCGGAGVLALGKAEDLAGPVEASYAVAIVLEATARDVETRHAGDPRAVQREAPRAVRGALQTMRQRGLLAGTPRSVATGDGTALAQEVAPVPIRPMDWTLIDAQSYAYHYGDRPLSRGMPVLSADGHPSHLARLADPADPLTPTTQDAQQRASSRRTGAVLAAAATEPKTTRTRRPPHGRR